MPCAGVCGSCLTETRHTAVTRCVAAVDYRYPWDSLIARFKFRHEPGWAQLLAELMWTQARNSDLTSPQTLWVPVPVVRRRLIERGYNQAWELCRALQQRSGLPAMASALVRLGDAPDQHDLPHAQRLNNLKGAFAAHPDQVSHLHQAHVVLIDDVRTTGATLEHAALALRQAGCARVDALVFARTALGREETSD
jgi:ComF family protein